MIATSTSDRRRDAGPGAVRTGADPASGAARARVGFPLLSRWRTGRTDSVHVGDAVRERAERDPAGRARRRWLGVLIGLLVALLVAEVAVRLIEPRLPEPSDWFSPEAARLVREMDHARANGVRSDLLITGARRAKMLAQEPAQTRNGPRRDFSVGAREISAFRRTLRSLERQGIDVHVVIVPGHEGYVAAHPQGAADYDAWRTAVKAAARAEGVPINDHANDFPSDGFIDFEHLNATSAQEFSRTIATELQQGNR